MNNNFFDWKSFENSFSKFSLATFKRYNILKNLLLSGLVGGDSCSRGRGFESQYPDTR